MSTQPTPEQPARDFIVEYRAGQFQNGSLVLRFQGTPNEQELRAALKDFGLPSSAVEEVRARPMNSGRLWDHIYSAHDTLSQSRWPEQSAPQKPQRQPRQRGPQGIREPGKKSSGTGCATFFAVAVLVFGVFAFSAEDAQREGEFAGYVVPSNADSFSHCFESMRVAGARNDGADQFFGDEVTGFPVSPQNAAFLGACLNAAP